MFQKSHRYRKTYGKENSRRLTGWLWLEDEIPCSVVAEGVKFSSGQVTHSPDSTSLKCKPPASFKTTFYLIPLNDKQTGAARKEGRKALGAAAVTRLHWLPAFPALSNPFVPHKVIVINADLPEKPGWRKKWLHWRLPSSDPFSTQPPTPAALFSAPNAT